MSRGYRVRLPDPTWRNSTTRVASSDAMAMDVGLLEILPEAAMAGLLRERLAEDGWSKGQDGVMRRSFGAVEAELSADGRTITARSTVTKEVKVRATSEAKADIRAALQGALQKVYVEALQRKAASLGQPPKGGRIRRLPPAHLRACGPRTPTGRRGPTRRGATDRGSG